MPFSLDPDLIENNDVKITTNASNEFVLEHKITGNTLTLGSNGTLDVDSLSTGKVGGGFFDGSTVSSHPNWDEDDNSPDSTGSVPSYTFSLASEHDVVVVDAVVVDEANTTTTIDLQVNGDTTTNYNYIDQSASRTTGDDRLPIAQITGGNARRLRFTIPGTWPANGFFAISTGMRGSDTVETLGGDNRAVGSPLTQFTLLRSSNFSIDNITVGGKTL